MVSDRSASTSSTSSYPTIDLNADVGEDCGDDAAMLAVVTSANIACGAHAGGGWTMAGTVAESRRRGVVIGAHVSYPDREHFGRRVMALSPTALHDEVLSQILALATIAGTDLHYVKAHGALYNVMADDAEVASSVVGAVRSANDHLGADLAVLVLAGTPAVQVATDGGLRAYGEGFADRAYTPTGRLRPRSENGAVLGDPAAIAAQAVALAEAGVVRSICLHGDNPVAASASRAVRVALEAAGFTIVSFVHGTSLR